MAQDRRIRYTKALLRDALLEMMKDRPIHRISVKELCERADVNRSTFYTHFGSPEDLLSGIRDDLKQRLLEEPADAPDLNDSILRVCSLLRENRDLLEVLMRRDLLMDYLLQITEAWKERFIRFLIPRSEGQDAEMLWYFTVTGSMSVICIWVLDGFRASAEEISEKIMRMWHGACRGMEVSSSGSGA